MTNQEFFDRTKISVSESEFDQIHDMYMEAGEMDKDTFCQDFKQHKDSLLVKTFYRQSSRLKDKIENARNYIYKIADFLIDQAEVSSSTELRNKAIEILGLEEYLNRKIKKNYQLWEADRQDLIEILSGHLKSQKELY